MSATARLLLAAGLIALTLAAPASVAAHAELVLASPAPGTGLAQAPAAVVIKFSEPLNLALSRIQVLDSSGTDVGEGPTEAVPGDVDAARRPLGLLPTGQYVVRWTSVSALDGHTLSGSYSFAVGTSANPETTIADSPLDSEGPFGLVGRFVALVALGAWLASSLLRGASARAGLDPVKVDRAARAAPATAFLGTLVSLLSTTFVATGSLMALGGVLASPSGQARLAVLAATALGVLVGTRWVLIRFLLAAVAILADAAAGHAASSVAPPMGIASFSLHLAAVGVWTWAIVASLVAAGDLRRALGTFTPYAVTAAVVVAATGVVNVILELADPADLVQTAYGLVLVAKSAAFLTMAGLGLTHFLWRRRPAIPQTTLRLPLRSEAIAAMLAFGLATLLVGFPNPPREAEATAEGLTGTDPVLAAIGARDALSIAAGSGPFVVGLTILPPTPGPAEVRVDVVGVEPGDGLRNARLSADSGGLPVDVQLGEACGLGCFAGRITFPDAGTWRLKLDIESNRGPISISETIPLPAPDGSAALARTLAAEESLGSAAMSERLSSSVDGPAYITSFRFEAPDRMESKFQDATTIFAAAQAFRRTGNGPWEKSSLGAAGFSWPAGYYREFWGAMAAPRILGSETVDGTPTTVIAFVRPDVPAWFRLWVRQSDGVVLREQMRAQGHLMDHAFSQLNSPISITLPR